MSYHINISCYIQLLNILHYDIFSGEAQNRRSAPLRGLAVLEHVLHHVVPVDVLDQRPARLNVAVNNNKHNNDNNNNHI